MTTLGSRIAGSGQSTQPCAGRTMSETKQSEFEEAIRLAEVGEYLFRNHCHVYGDGYNEPRELAIDWSWVQSMPNEYGEGVLLAEATTWHAEMAEEGTPSEASKLRESLTWRPISEADKDAERLALGIVRNGSLEEIHIGGYRYAINDDDVSCWWSDQADDEIVPTHWMFLPALPTHPPISE